MYESASSLLIPFISLCILSVLVDKLTLVLEEIMKKIPWLPNSFWGPVAYFIVFFSSFIVCWRGNFNFFSSLNFSFRNEWEGWFMTSLLISGGSAFVRTSFGVISTLPQAVSNVVSTVGGFLSSAGEVSQHRFIEAESTERCQIDDEGQQGTL